MLELGAVAHLLSRSFPLSLLLDTRCHLYPSITPPTTVHTIDARIQRDDEFSDSEDEGTGGRRDRSSHQNGSSKSKKSSTKSSTPATTASGIPLTSDLIPPSTRPPAPKPETVPGVPEGEDVDIPLYEGPPATTSAARATTTAAQGEDDAKAEDVEMGDVPAEGVPAPKGDTPIPF